MTSSSSPTLALADGTVPIGSLADPVVVDPDPSLLAALVAAYRDAAPAMVDPDLDALRAGARDDADPLSSIADLPGLTVLASGRAVDAITDRFHPASRLAALAEAGVWDLRTLTEPQPNTVLAGRSDGCVLVAATDGRESGRRSRCRIGDDATLRDRYDPLVAVAETVRIRTPSRHRLYGALRERCGSEVADEAVRLIDNDAGGSDPLDRDLRRACEDAELGSSATFTRVKRDLVEADLLATESVSQPVGRPRQRLVARGALADASSPTAALGVLEALREEDL